MIDPGIIGQRVSFLARGLIVDDHLGCMDGGAGRVNYGTLNATGGLRERNTCGEQQTKCNKGR